MVSEHAVTLKKILLDHVAVRGHNPRTFSRTQ